MAEIEITLEKETLYGDLVIVEGSKALVIFAHGSGSSRHSKRNRFVAEMFNKKGLSTLLFDLLTEQEEEEDQFTMEHRFNIFLLAKRLSETTRWLLRNPKTSSFSMGYFGASTGAAAALIAATENADSIKAIVSRGGRPDLAKGFLEKVDAPTLLIVGGDDIAVIGMNKEASDQLRCEKKTIIIDGATHLFEEKGKLEEVAKYAGEWFFEKLLNSL